MFRLLCVPRLLFVCLLSAACDGHTRSELDRCKSWRYSTEAAPASPPLPEWPHSLQVFKQIPFFFPFHLAKKKKLPASSSVPHMRFVRASAGMWPWPPLADLWPLQTIHHIRHTVWQRPSPAAQPAGHKVSADWPLKDRFIFSTHFRRCLSVSVFFFSDAWQWRSDRVPFRRGGRVEKP